MAHISSSILLVLLFLLSGCKSNKVQTRFPAGSCIEEVDGNWASYAKNKNNIYKFHFLNGQRLVVSIWNRKNWLYHGEKSLFYFNDKKAFKYKKVGCPDGGKSGKGITEKIKSIAI